MNTFIKLIQFSIALILTLLWHTCSDEPTKPPPNNSIDSTTHNWRFEIDTLGGYNSGAHDVVAFSENDAYVSGEFRVYPNPNDITNWETYDLAHFDGKKWKLIQIKYPYMYAGTLYALNKNFIVLYSLGLNFFNGNYWSHIYIPPNTITLGVSGTWAKSPSEIHMIGGGGMWLIWDGDLNAGNFRRVQTLTNIDLTDIYGDGVVIYACGRTQVGDRSIILRNEKGIITVVDSAITPGQIQISAVWHNAKYNVFASAGNKNGILDGTWKEESTFQNYLDAVRGSSRNNVWWAGNFLSLQHYNGSTLKVFKKPFPQSGVLESIDVHESFFFASGFQVLQNGGLRGVVVRGYKVK